MNDTRFLSALNLSSKAKDALAINGYQSVQDLVGVLPQELMDELGLTLPEAQEILSSTAPLAPSQGLHASLPPSSSYSISASQLLSRPLSLPIISTLSRSVDSLLLPSHGVQQGMIVEIAGGPGVGKTSALIGLAMDARRAAEERKAKGEEGGGGEVLILDTEGSINVARLEQAAISVASGSGSSETPSGTPSSLLQGMHLTRIHTLPQFISFFMTLETFLRTNPKISLLLIDTLSHPIRSPAVPPDGKSKGRIVALIKSTLQKCSALFEVGIVTSVQLATKFVDSEGKPGNFDPDSRAILTPQLGESYMPLKTQRILLFFGGGSPTSPEIRRYATTLPSPNPNPSSNSNSFQHSSSPFPSQHQHQRGSFLPGMGGASLAKNGGENGWGGGGGGKSQRFGGEEKEEKPRKWARFEISDEGLFRDIPLEQREEDEEDSGG